jgi:hypothetical protein
MTFARQKAHRELACCIPRLAAGVLSGMLRHSLFLADEWPAWSARTGDHAYFFSWSQVKLPWHGEHTIESNAVQGDAGGVVRY